VKRRLSAVSNEVSAEAEEISTVRNYYQGTTGEDAAGWKKV
jgi:hypothetical protein